MTTQQEMDMTYELPVQVAYLNKDLRLKPQAYQMLYCEMAETHLKHFSAGSDETMKYGVAWALISIIFDIKRPVTGLETLYAKTWKSGLKGPYFLRDFQFADKDGNVYFQGTSYSILLNVTTRKVCRDKKLPFFSMEALPVRVSDGEPTWKAAYGRDDKFSDLAFEPVEQRLVRNSHIDMLGHMNNARYGEFVYDTFTEQQMDSLGDISRLEIYFEGELTLGDRMDISIAKKDNITFYRGTNATTKATAFDFVLCPSLNAYGIE